MHQIRLRRVRLTARESGSANTSRLYLLTSTLTRSIDCTLFRLLGPLLLDKHFAIGNFIASAMADEDIQISGDGTPLRSYLYAGDLAHWLWVMLFQAPNARAYNVGGSESLSITALAERVNTVLGGKGMVLVAKEPIPGASAQPTCHL